MNCLNCSTETGNPKFCCRSCSTAYNNRANPKRKPENSCKTCGAAINSTRTYCPEHTRDYGSTTKGELYGDGNVNWGGNGAYIRGHARRTYRSSGRPKQCFVCGYSLHYDVAHIKDINSYPMTATLNEINNIDNLVALCKNHHWEFDHGHLTIQF